MKYEAVEFSEDTEPAFHLWDKADSSRRVEWKVPFFALANRIELYGLDSVEHSLELIAKECGNPAVREVLPSVNSAYAAVVSSEFAQSLMSHPRMEEDEGKAAQTVMRAMAIGPDKREHLAAVRADALSKLGVTPAASSLPQVRLAMSAEPVAIAAQAFDTSEEVVQQVCQEADKRREQLEGWRVQVAMGVCPQLKTMVEAKLAKLMESKDEVS